MDCSIRPPFLADSPGVQPVGSPRRGRKGEESEPGVPIPWPCSLHGHLRCFPCMTVSSELPAIVSSPPTPQPLHLGAPPLLLLALGHFAVQVVLTVQLLDQ